MDFTGVIPQDLAIGALWPQISALTERAMVYGRGEYEIEDIKERIESGQMFAIGRVTEQCEVQFVAICAVCKYPRRRVLYVVYGAGTRGAEAEEALLSAAKALKCDWIETRCRESVARLYRRYGFDIGYQVAILELSK